MAIGRSDYKERKESKIDRLKARARKASIEANQEFNNASNMGSVIPLGQPILVGHHSEKGHCRLLKRIDSAYRRGSEAEDKSAYYQDRAESAANNQAISGDNSEAENLYKKKLEKLEAAQERMKAVNKAWRKGKAALYDLGFTDEEIEKIKSSMPTYEKNPYPTWKLSNNNAEIRRIKQKLEELSRLDSMEEESSEFPNGKMLINTEINRIQFIFNEIPSEEIRKLLKSHGFKWSPSEKAWQRQRTLNAVHTTERLIKDFFSKL